MVITGGCRLSVIGCELSVVGSASCGVRWEICLFLLVELMMSVVGCRFSVVGCRLWVLLRVGCGGKSVCFYSLSL
jgi:hypothetical protein